jgi:hypothetical protein
MCQTRANACRTFSGTSFSRNKKSNTKNHTGLWWGTHWVIGRGGVGYRGAGMIISRYSRPFLIANDLTHTPYSWQLLIGPTELLLTNYCTILGQ